jgi:hypothetical protein
VVVVAAADAAHKQRDGVPLVVEYSAVARDVAIGPAAETEDVIAEGYSEAAGIEAAQEGNLS